MCVSAIDRLVASLKRLFARPATSDEVPAEARTADLTPPAAPAPPLESAPAEPILPPTPSASVPVVDQRPAVEPLVEPVAEVAPEVRSEADSEPAPSVEADSAVPETLEVPAPTSVASPETSPAAAAVLGGELVLRLQTERTPAPSFVVAKSSATLGRGEGNTIRLEDLSVSRKHARITYRQGGYWLSDVGSVSGTWVDGTKLNAPRRIAVGQIIDIGVCRLTVESAGEEAASSGNGTPKRSELAEQGRRRR